MGMSTRVGFAAAALALIISLDTTVAGSATWLANPGSGDWHAASNWTPGGPPNDPADTATFDSSTVSNLLISATTTRIGSIIFKVGGGTPYKITASALEFRGSGITNNSGITQKFVTVSPSALFYLVAAPVPARTRRLSLRRAMAR
jgi:hypothetical protein